MDDLYDKNITKGLDPNSPYYQQNLDLLNSPEYKARIEEQKRKIAEFKAAQGATTPEQTISPEMEIPKVSEETTMSQEPEQEQEDPRLALALQMKQDRENKANLLRAFQQINQAMASGTGFKADMSTAEAIEKSASDPLKIYQTKIESEQAKQKAGQEQEKHNLFIQDAKARLDAAQIKIKDAELGKDPTSPISRVSQDIAIQYLKMSGQPYNEERIRNTPGDDLIQIIPDMQKIGVEYFRDMREREQMKSQETIAQQKLNADLSEKELLRQMEERRQREQDARRTQEDKRERQKQIDTARGLLKDDPRFKDSMKQSMEFDSVNELISEAEKGNQMAVAALGTKLARAMGEVGVLTDTDVTRYVAGQSWGRKLKDWFTKGATGELSEATLNDIKKNLKVIQSKLNSDVNKVYTKAYDRMKAAYPDADEQFIKGVLGFSQPISKSQELSAKDQEALDWANKNPNDPRAAKIKEKLGK